MYLLQVLITVAPILLGSLAAGVPLDDFYSYPFNATLLTTFTGKGLTGDQCSPTFMLYGKTVNTILVSFIIIFSSLSMDILNDNASCYIK